MKRDIVGLRFCDLERMLKAENPNIPDDIKITRVMTNIANFSTRAIAIEFASEEVEEVSDEWQIYTKMIDKYTV